MVKPHLDTTVLNARVHGQQHLRQFVVPRRARQGQQRLPFLRGLVHGPALREQLADRAHVAVRTRLRQGRSPVRPHRRRDGRRRARRSRPALGAEKHITYTTVQASDTIGCK